MAGTQRGRSQGVLQVFNQLEQIARFSGKGSQKEKSSRLARLLSEVSGLEAKYMVRTILGSHRIGVADMTFLRALAKAYTGTTGNKEIIENAYSVLPDLGKISRRAARSGLAGLRRIGPTPGTPVRMMLASRVQELEEVGSHMRGEMFVEYKYDGERVQVHVDGGGHVHALYGTLDVKHCFSTTASFFLPYFLSFLSFCSTPAEPILSFSNRGRK
jgi:DNA ligase 1